jgi:5-formyltetrahydrofolate cyclo-ligase
MRGALSDNERASATYAASTKLQSTTVFRHSRRVAAYVGFDGELDTGQIIAAALTAGKTVYLPVIDNLNHMRFAHFDEDTELRTNQFGILEPVTEPGHFMSPRWLDLVISPLVAFDTNGNRLGMGAGYYDKCFSFLLQRRMWRKPRMVGFAYEFQREDMLAPQPWDVPLDCIITDETIHFPKRQIQCP